MTTRYPLTWPFGWKRTAGGNRQRAKFAKKESFTYSSGYTGNRSKELTIANALERLFSELERLGAQQAIISTNIETRLDGTPRSDRRAPDDPGVAVYFKLKGKDRVLACDKWDRVADNIAAIAAHIDAIRRQDRYGVGTLDQAFAGYEALPAPGPPKRDWWDVLQVRREMSIEAIEMNFRRLAKDRHPDRDGGSHESMAELNDAMSQARKERAAA